MVNVFCHVRCCIKAVWRGAASLCYGPAMRGLTLFFLLIYPALAQAAVEGKPRVHNSGLLVVSGVDIVLYGIDAPERAQNCRRNNKEWRCGRYAARALIDKIGGQAVRCEERDVDEFERILGVCYMGETDLNAWLVQEGWALAYPWHTDAYVDFQLEAKESKKGLWRSEFIPPSEWRAGSRLTWKRPVYVEAPEDCVVKGNINSIGQYTYHVPGGHWYDRVKIDSARGERWFCSEEEAEEAGWTKAER